MADNDDDLSAAVASAFESTQTPNSSPETPPSVASEAPPSEPSGKSSEGERTRDESGKFVKSETGKTTQTPKPAAQDNTLKAPGETPTAAQAQTSTPTRVQHNAPTSWKGAGKVEWQRLPPHVQEALIQDYAERDKASSELQALRSAVGDQRLQNLALQYGSVENGLRSILAGADMANQNPGQFIQWLAQRAGLNLAQLANGGSPQGQAMPQQHQQIPPELTNHPLVQRLSSLESSLQQMVQQQQQHTTTQLQAEIDSFQNDPNHPYFNDVRSHMGILIGNGQAKTLEQAYEMAVWAHPEARKGLIEKERQSVIDANAAKVAQAKQAAGSLSGSPVGASVPPDEPEATLEAEVARAVAKHYRA